MLGGQAHAYRAEHHALGQRMRQPFVEPGGRRARIVVVENDERLPAVVLAQPGFDLFDSTRYPQAARRFPFLMEAGRDEAEVRASEDALDLLAGERLPPARADDIAQPAAHLLVQALENALRPAAKISRSTASGSACLPLTASRASEPPYGSFRHSTSSMSRKTIGRSPDSARVAMRSIMMESGGTRAGLPVPTRQWQSRIRTPGRSGSCWPPRCPLRRWRRILTPRIDARWSRRSA